MKISIIGSGVVGQKIGFGLKESGHQVIFHDINSKVIEDLRANDMEATLDIKEAISNSDITFVCIPTPTNENGIDLTYVESVSKDIGEIIKNKDDYHIFVFKSTVIPGTTENTIIPLIEKHSNKKVNTDFGLVFSPEFFTASSKQWSEDQHRIIIGEGEDKRAGDVVEELHKPLNLPVFRRDYKTAEFIKYSANINLITKISINNELFKIAKKLGIDGYDVSQIVALDKRIGKYGTKPGKAFGGGCFPKDLQAFVMFLEQTNTHNPNLIKEMHNLNEEMKRKYGIHEED